MLPRQPRAPSLGDLADDYLTSHGYDLDLICQIVDAFDSTASAEDFALFLAPSGFPIAEALFLYRLIDVTDV